jgi:predicted dehydrogenase
MSKIQLAFLGTGGIARKHSNSAKDSDDVDVVGICDVSDAAVETFSHEFDDTAFSPASFTDADQMYRETQPDAVVICTPHTLHYDHCVQALDHGCHVLVEKPMVTSLAHATSLEAKVATTGKVLTVGYNTSCSAIFYTIRDIIRDGTYGKLKVISMDISQGWYQAVKGSWRMQPELSGGGMIYDSGAHVLNSLVWSVESDVAEVHAWVDNLDVAVDINGTMNIRFTNGVIATVAVGGEVPSGSHATYMFERARITCDPWGASFVEARTNEGVVELEMRGPQSDPFGNFIDAIRGRAEARTGPRSGVIQSQLMDAIYESARTGLPATP